MLTGVKSKVANQIYDKLDELAIKDYSKTRLGGTNSVVLAEMYPDCLNRLSPDTTDHPHVHKILMLADTKVRHIFVNIFISSSILTVICYRFPYPIHIIISSRVKHDHFRFF